MRTHRDMFPSFREPESDFLEAIAGETGRLWSLSEMVNFFFNSIYCLLAELNLAISLSRQNTDYLAQIGISTARAAMADSKGIEAAKQACEQIDWCCKIANEHLSALKCPHINEAINKLRESPREPFNWSELNTRSRALRDAIMTELKQYFFYQYPKQKGDKLRSWTVDWRRAVESFPQSERDIFSATDCYALGYNTASIFHSMRVAEYGLRALAKERRITLPKNKPLEWGNWQEIIKALDDEIRAIGSKKPGKAKDAALEFYSGARADLNGFKDEYRNLVMHARADYDEHQALRALSNVHSFMIRLADKIDHQHQRIKWGFR